MIAIRITLSPRPAVPPGGATATGVRNFGLEPGTRYYYQVSDGASEPSTAGASFETAATGAEIPNGTTAYTRFCTGGLKHDAKDDSLVPDYTSGRSNLQTIWLEKTLAQARRDPSVDMIVVFMHQCAMSTSVPGNGSDLGIRQAWLPLFDKYEVDLVLSGHEHDYERTYPVRGYDAGDLATVVAPNPGQVKGAARPRCRRSPPRSSSSAAGRAAGDAVTGCRGLLPRSFGRKKGGG
jgi:3',5'-cyclic AMP phosphodiesterase CpdA